MANKAIKYRLYPTTEQRILFAKTFGCCRKVWNLMLNDKISYYKENGKMLITTPAQYKEEYPYLKEVDSLALANVQINLQTAYRNFFRSLKEPKKNNKAGFPKFKSAKHSRKSYTTNNQNGTVAICDGAVKLPKIGFVKAVIHRFPEDDWELKSATVSQERDGTYYVSMLFEFDTDIRQVSIDFENAIGLDYKSDGLYKDSNSNIGSCHKFYRQSEKKISRAQKTLSRRKGSKKGEEKSKNYIKQQRKVAKLHRHAANQRLDSLHKISTGIANQYDIVCAETLDMKAMSNKSFGNGKATLDNGYGMFLNMLEYKLAERGKYFVKVDKWYPSSQICCKCGRRHKMPLSERIYTCVCGNNMDRDDNAAINIKNEGLRILMESLAA